MISDTPKPSRISNSTSTMLPPPAPIMYWSAWSVMGTRSESISSMNATAPFKIATISSTRITSNPSPPVPGKIVPCRVSFCACSLALLFRLCYVLRLLTALRIPSQSVILLPCICLQHAVLDLLVQLRSDGETDIPVLPRMDLPAGHEHGQSLLAVCHAHPCHQELPVQADRGNGFQPALVLIPGNNLTLNFHQSLLHKKIPTLPLW